MTLEALDFRTKSQSLQRGRGPALNKFRRQAQRFSSHKTAHENYLVGLLPRRWQYALIKKGGLPFAVRHDTAIALRALASKPPGPLVRGGFFASFGTR